MQAILTRRSDNRLSLEIANDEGQILYQKIINRYKDKEVKFLAELCKWNIPTATQKVNEVCDTSVNNEYVAQTVEISPPKALIESILESSKSIEGDDSTFTVYVRELNQLKKFATSYVDKEPQEALRAALSDTVGATEPILEWDNKNIICCLDIDYHDIEEKSRPGYSQLKTLVSKIKPQPFCWHPSHSGGSKLYYIQKPGYTAEELAAVAGLHYIQLDNTATFDLIKASRHPFYSRARDNSPPPCGETIGITYTYGNGDLSSVRKLLLSDIEHEEVLEYVASKNWKIGQTLPHSECPINPTREYKENVYIGEKGIYCHKCHAQGLGANGSGFVGYGSLIGGTDSRITTMVKGFCHLEHARLILSNIYPDIPLHVLDIVYRVMLKIVHTPDDPRVPLAMAAGKGFIRTRGMWVSADGRTAVTNNLLKYTQSLPGVLIPHEKGYSINIAKHTALMNGGVIEEHGYPDITFLRGCKIYGQFMPYRGGENIRCIVRPEFAKCPPKYLIQSKRMPTAWELLEDEFPGIDRNYVKLLIAAKGASEGRLAQCPFLLITGPAGSGKSTTPQIAAGICGDKAEEPVYTPNPERFRAALMDSAKESSFIVVNEIFKSAELARLNHIQALTPMLSLTEDSRSHVLFVGSVPFGRLPVFVLTDVAIPNEVESDIQIARRFTYYRLNSRNYWEDTLSTKGIRPHEFRLLSPDHALAADTILSEIIDEFFQEAMPFKQIADKLSAQSLETWSDNVDNKHVYLKDFYKEVLLAPPISGSDAKRYTAEKGWKRVDKINNNKLNDLWSDLCDGNNAEQWQHSRAIESEDWSKLLNLDFSIVCDIRPYQSSAVYVRFRSTDSPKTPSWINGKIV